MKSYNAESSTSPIQTMSGPVRDLALHLMLRGFSVGVNLGAAPGLLVEPLNLRSAEVLGQVKGIVLDFEGLEAILPDARERFGLSGTRIAWDYIREDIRNPSSFDETYFARFNFDHWLQWSSDVELLDGDGKVIGTTPDLGDPDLYMDDHPRAGVSDV